ncbi:MAG: threonine ammonia-lyase [Bdellovibrionales bacterium]|nr:threonine ammonia-lyase [Bdellovibrionales bacterium]
MTPITLKDIELARETLKVEIDTTPLFHSRSCSDLIGTDVFLKLENQQKTGSFKIRGAFNKIASLTEAEKSVGVVAASAGNHAQGVALAASLAGATSHIVMPKNSPTIKIQSTQAYGAQVTLHGEIYDEAFKYAFKLAQERGQTFIHPYKDPKVIAGQGTIGLELLDEIHNLDSIVVPIGGGGLISGVGLAIKTLRPSCKVYGVVAKQASGMKNLFHQEKVDHSLSFPSIADGISVKEPSLEMYNTYIKQYVDDVVAVDEDEIAEALVFLLERTKHVVEGSGAVTLAAVARKKWDLGKKCALVVSGGNIDLNLVSKVIERGLSKNGRLARVYLAVEDRPGTLTRITKAMGENDANILDIYHDRLSPNLRLRETVLNILFEAKGPEHLKSVLESLEQAGGRIIR